MYLCSVWIPSTKEQVSAQKSIFLFIYLTYVYNIFILSYISIYQMKMSLKD